MMIQSNRIKVGVPLYCCRTKIHKSLCRCLPSGSEQPPLGPPRSPPPQAKHFPQPRKPSPSPHRARPSPPRPHVPSAQAKPHPHTSPPVPHPAAACAAPRPLASLTPIPQRAEGYPSRPPRMSLRALTDIPHGGSPLSPAAARSSSPLCLALGRNSCPRTRRDTSRQTGRSPIACPRKILYFCYSSSYLTQQLKSI